MTNHEPTEAGVEGGGQEGVTFPRGRDGRRSTSELGRLVVADALRGVDPVGARQAEQETAWRSGYVPHFRRLVEAGLSSRDDALSIARGGLDSLHRRMVAVTGDGAELPLAEWDVSSGDPLGSETVAGRAEPETELTLPFHGERLRGDALRRRLDAWVAAGVMEPSAAEAVRLVMANPDWLRLDGRTTVVLGAGSEMGPLRALLRWGAHVVAVDLPRPGIWARVLETVREGAGSAVVPVSGAGGDLAHRAGVDVIAEAPRLSGWLGDLDLGPAARNGLVLGNYVYADGALNVRVSTAVDLVTTRLLAARPDTALAFLATPTDVFAVPGEAVAHSVAAYDTRGRPTRLLSRPLRAVSGGRLLRRAYQPGSDPGISDSLVAQQGPNYALAKRLQRWRAAVARHQDVTVSLNVAPPTRTRSVVKNRALAAAYAGAHRFGVEVFEPATANVLMAALLVHDLHTGGDAAHGHPWQDEAAGAVHGGLWRAAYAPRSALGLAALLGYGAARA